jgi:hypothetical protein
MTIIPQNKTYESCYIVVEECYFRQIVIIIVVVIEALD